MSDWIAEACSDCGYMKPNRYGLCGGCFLFPSEQDYTRWDRERIAERIAASKELESLGGLEAITGGTPGGVRDLGEREQGMR